MSDPATPTPPPDMTMPTRLAGMLGLVAFAYALLSGLFEAENSFSTIVQRALVALVITLFVGYVIGWAAQVMLNENLKKIESENLEKSLKDEGEDGR
jgi:NhaP-type Na+/H+ or K+/H+ antiporter